MTSLTNSLNLFLKNKNQQGGGIKELFTNKIGGKNIYELDPVNRIIVLGDIHGDFEKLIITLIKLKIIDYKFNWIAGNTVLVQLGDQIDSYRNHPNFKDNNYSDLKVLFFFNILSKKANEKGGKVYSLLGNHEIMNVMNNFSYVSESGFKEFETMCKGNKNKLCNIQDGRTIRKKAFEKGGILAKMFAKNRYSILKIGSNLFCHGDVIKDLADKYTITEINENIKKWLNGEIISNDFERFILDSNKSHFWSRKYSMYPINNNSNECNELNNVLKTYNVGNLIVGHTPQSNGINSSCETKLWKADIGFNRTFSLFDARFQKVEALEIINDNIFNIIKL